MIVARRHSPLAYLARYAYIGQHRRGRLDTADRLAEQLDELRARARSRRQHPAGTRLNLAGVTAR